MQIGWLSQIERLSSEVAKRSEGIWGRGSRPKQSAAAIIMHCNYVFAQSPNFVVAIPIMIIEDIIQTAPKMYATFSDSGLPIFIFCLFRKTR